MTFQDISCKTSKAANTFKLEQYGLKAFEIAAITNSPLKMTSEWLPNLQAIANTGHTSIYINVKWNQILWNYSKTNTSFCFVVCARHLSEHAASGTASTPPIAPNERAYDRPATSVCSRRRRLGIVANSITIRIPLIKYILHTCISLKPFTRLKAVGQKRFHSAVLKSSLTLNG